MVGSLAMRSMESSNTGSQYLRYNAVPSKGRHNIPAHGWWVAAVPRLNGSVNSLVGWQVQRPAPFPPTRIHRHTGTPSPGSLGLVDAAAVSSRKLAVHLQAGGQEVPSEPEAQRCKCPAGSLLRPTNSAATNACTAPSIQQKAPAARAPRWPAGSWGVCRGVGSSASAAGAAGRQRGEWLEETEGRPIGLPCQRPNGLPPLPCPQTNVGARRLFTPHQADRRTAPP